MRKDLVAGHSIFNSFASSYRHIINKSVKLSGEEYEFFIHLRIKLMLDRLERFCPAIKSSSILDFGCGTGVHEEKGEMIAMVKYFVEVKQCIDRSISSRSVCSMPSRSGTWVNSDI